MNYKNILLEKTKQLHVLYAEDEAILQASMKEVFSNFFKNVDTVSNGLEGVEAYKNFYNANGYYYDLIITDISMPLLDGIEMSQEIYTINPTQSIIITSAHNENDYLMRSLTLGVDSYILKPILMGQLTSVLSKVSTSIVEHKLVQEHLETIENSNFQLSQENKNLHTQNMTLEKSLRMLDTMIKKDHILQARNSQENQTIQNAQANTNADQINDLVSHDMDELQELLIEIDVCIIEILNSVGSISIDTLPRLIKLFTRYASILRMYPMFDALSNALMEFSEAMKTNSLPQNDEVVNDIFLLLESFVYVLIKWQKDISEASDKKINEFDDSIISDIKYISNLWLQKDEDPSKFGTDDIFDF